MVKPERPLIDSGTIIAMSIERATLGASRSVVEGTAWQWPLHGLRHPPRGETSGWYLWTGELQDDAEFFLPWHADHAIARCPDLRDLLRLAPGSRFLYAPDHLDVWEDASLLDV